MRGVAPKTFIILHHLCCYIKYFNRNRHGYLSVITEMTEADLGAPEILDSPELEFLNSFGDRLKRLDEEVFRLCLREEFL